MLADPGCARADADDLLWHGRNSWWLYQLRAPRCGGCGRPVTGASHPDHDGPAHPDCCTVCAEDVAWLSGALGSPGLQHLLQHAMLST